MASEALKAKALSLSLIVPIYEDEDPNVEMNIFALIQKLDDLIRDKDYELLIICSQKRRSFLEPHLSKGRETRLGGEIKFFDHENNTELGYMFAKGVRLATKDYVGLITPYNQVDLESLGPILQGLRSHDMVVVYIGNPHARPLHRIVASAINTFLVNCIFGLKLKYYHLGFYRSALVKKVPFTTDSHAALVEAMVWMAKSNFDVIQVPFTMVPHRFKSKSRAFRAQNLVNIFKTYAKLFWRTRVKGERLP